LYRPYSWHADRYDRFGAHHKCRATPEYEDTVIRTWRANHKQIVHMMTTVNGCIWEYG
jgi:hypothetical protein